MTVLDSYAVLALFNQEFAAGSVQNLVESGSCVLTPLGVSEIVDCLVRRFGATEDDAALDLTQLGLRPTASLSAELALRAGLLRARHYHRTDRTVSLADCVAAETARSSDEALATADPHLLDLCLDEQIRTIALPDSRGVTWSR